MSVQSCMAFLAKAQSDPDLAASLRAVTDIQELFALGQGHGYSFDTKDVADASAAPLRTPAGHSHSTTAPIAQPMPTASTIYHYEVDLLGVPELSPLLDELPNLTIKPSSVDLDGFAATFRREDLDWTAMSPAAPAFRRCYEEVMRPNGNETHRPAPGRRDFHLINLDQHIEHPLYDSYFQAKVRTVRHLSRIFGPEIKCSGSMWYPPLSYRLWHTNENQPGWRMYLIDLDRGIANSDEPFFRYMNPATKELVTLRDRPKLLRFFKIEQAGDSLFWHCIVNATQRHRWSFGFVLPDDWASRLQAAAPAAATDHCALSNP